MIINVITNRCEKYHRNMVKCVSFSRGCAGDTLGMEGNVIERRTSSVQAWSEARQSTLPSTSASTALTPTPTGVPSYSNIFPVPAPVPDAERRVSPEEPSPTTSSDVQVRDGELKLDQFCCSPNRPLLESIWTKKTQIISTFFARCTVPKIQVSARNRASTENNFADTEVEELIAMLRETENLEEQGDILQYLVDTQGLDYNTGMYRALDQCHWTNLALYITCCGLFFVVFVIAVPFRLIHFTLGGVFFHLLW